MISYGFYINQLTVIDEYTRHKYMELAMVTTVNWLIFAAKLSNSSSKYDFDYLLTSRDSTDSKLQVDQETNKGIKIRLQCV